MFAHVIRAMYSKRKQCQKVLAKHRQFCNDMRGLLHPATSTSMNDDLAVVPIVNGIHQQRNLFSRVRHFKSMPGYQESWDWTGSKQRNFYIKEMQKILKSKSIQEDPEYKARMYKTPTLWKECKAYCKKLIKESKEKGGRTTCECKTVIYHRFDKCPSVTQKQWSDLMDGDFMQMGKVVSNSLFSCDAGKNQMVDRKLRHSICAAEGILTFDLCSTCCCKTKGGALAQFSGCNALQLTKVRDVDNNIVSGDETKRSFDGAKGKCALPSAAASLKAPHNCAGWFVNIEIIYSTITQLISKLYGNHNANFKKCTEY